MPPLPSSRFADLSPSHARRVLLGFLVGTAALIAASFLPETPPSLEAGRGVPKMNLEGVEFTALLMVAPDAPFPATLPWPALILAAPKDPPDLLLYRAIVQRVHEGENYYAAAQEELRRRGYPTASAFNWRPPTYAWLFAALPDPRAVQIVLMVLALIAVALAYATLVRDAGVIPACIGLTLLTGTLFWCLVENAYLSQELWAGTLIVVSVAAYGLGWRWLGLPTGLLALFIRELALPYAVVAAAVAALHGRRRETGIWLAGIVLFFLFLGWHAQQVHARISDEDHRIVSEGWLRFGGVPFILLTGRMNRFLFDAPRWLIALYLAVALLGLAGWRGENGIRVLATVVLYLLAFLVVGNPRINDYWGLLYVGLLPLGLALAPAAAIDLCRALRKAPGP